MVANRRLHRDEIETLLIDLDVGEIGGFEAVVLTKSVGNLVVGDITEPYQHGAETAPFLLLDLEGILQLLPGDVSLPDQKFA